MRCTLSFDNGPHPDVTPTVLDVLRAHAAPALFFVCGRNLERPGGLALVRRARDAGHRIGNHTYSHSVEFGKSDDPSAPETEIGRTQALLGELGEPERLFRPAGGGGVLGPNLLSDAAVRYLRDGAYTCVLWNSVPRDWEDPTGWVDRALEAVRARDWTLVVLHDLPTGAMAALPSFLERLKEEKVELTADLPPDCVPILRGKLKLPLDPFVARRSPLRER